MADLSRSSTLQADPLHSHSGLSLFPRTLKSLSIPLPPRLNQPDDLQQTHTLLESMSFEVGKEHQEQAKAILDSSSDILKQGIGTSEDMNVGVKMNPIPTKRERRPGLDLKRATFVLKPMTSEPPQCAPVFDGSKYPKPEDFFAARHRHDLALREWQKQTGTFVPETHQNQPLRRPRRPGIPGMKRACFKDAYMKDYPNDAINLEAAKNLVAAEKLEASEKEDPIPSEESLERTKAAHVTTMDREVDDSTKDTSVNLKNILDELLACSPEELEGDAGVRFLEKRLQFKPIDLEMLALPEFEEIRNPNFKLPPRRNPSKRRTVLSDIQNMLKGIHSDAARKNSQSPSSSNPPGDQFSFPDSDHLLPGDQQSSEVDPVTNDADKIRTNAFPSIVDTVHVASPFNSSVQKTFNEDDSDTLSGIHRFNSSSDGNADNFMDDSITNINSAMLEVNVDMQTKGNEEDVRASEGEANRNTGRSENDGDINEETDPLEMLAELESNEVTRMDPFTVEEDSIPCQQDESSKSPNRTPEQYNTMDGSFGDAEHIQGQDEEENDNMDIAQEEAHNSPQEQSKKRRKRGSRNGNTKKRSKTVHGESEMEKQVIPVSHESGAKKQTKRKSNESEEKKKMKTLTREGKFFARRKSLAAAGTKMESGVRRSTRIKSRPLDFWRGERFLYGRIHESLTTVIGIKYGSPEKSSNENRPLKVKSFVSDKYKELVNFAALH